MKYLLILVIAFLGTSLAKNPSVDSIIDHKVRKAIENFQKQMPYGFPDYGIPPLAPFEYDFQNFNFENEIISAIGNISNIFAVGADDFDIRECSFNFFQGILKLELNLNNFHIQRGSYILDQLVIAGKEEVIIKGAGDIDFSIQNINLRATLGFGIFDGVKLTDFNAVLGVGSVRSNITGLISGELQNDFINRILEELILKTVKDRRRDISAIIKRFAVPFIKKFLAENQFTTKENFMK